MEDGFEIIVEELPCGGNIGKKFGVDYCPIKVEECLYFNKNGVVVANKEEYQSFYCCGYNLGFKFKEMNDWKK